MFCLFLQCKLFHFKVLIYFSLKIWLISKFYIHLCRAFYFCPQRHLIQLPITLRRARCATYVQLHLRTLSYNNFVQGLDVLRKRAFERMNCNTYKSAMSSRSTTAKVTIVLALLLCRSVYNDDVGQLVNDRHMPNHGVVFKGMSKMQTMRDVYLLHLHVRLPDLLEEVEMLKYGFDTIDESQMCDNMWQARENSTGKDVTEVVGAGIARVCEHYSVVVNKLRQKALIARIVCKVNGIGMYIPVFQSRQHAREKRALLSAVATVLGDAVSFINTIVTHPISISLWS